MYDDTSLAQEPLEGLLRPLRTDILTPLRVYTLVLRKMASVDLEKDKEYEYGYLPKGGNDELGEGCAGRPTVIEQVCCQRALHPHTHDPDQPIKAACFWRGWWMCRCVLGLTLARLAALSHNHHITNITHITPSHHHIAHFLHLPISPHHLFSLPSCRK